MRRATPRAVFFDAYPHTVGGVAHIGVLLAATLAEQGWHMEVVVPANGPAADLYRASGITAQVIAAPEALRRYGRRSLRGASAVAAVASLPRYWWRLARAFAAHDLVHVNDARGLIMAGPAARLARAQLVWHVHSQIDGAALGWLARLLRARLAVVSRAVTPRGLPRRAEVHVLPNTPTQSTAVANHSGEHHSPTLLTIGRLHPEKGLDVLLAASALMRQVHVQHHVQIVGGMQDGYEDYPLSLQQTAQRLGVAADVEFVGVVDDPTPWLQRACVYVQPSRREAFGLATLEAMHAGLPVVASSVGGLTELVVDGVTGRLVAPGDPAALAAAITGFLNDSDSCRTFGEAGRRRADEHYGVDRFRDAVRDLYAAATARA